MRHSYKLLLAIAMTVPVFAQEKKTEAPKPAPAPAPVMKPLDASQEYSLEHAVASMQEAQKLVRDVAASIEAECGGTVQPSGGKFVCVVQPKPEAAAKK